MQIMCFNFYNPTDTGDSLVFLSSNDFLVYLPSPISLLLKNLQLTASGASLPSMFA